MVFIGYLVVWLEPVCDLSDGWYSILLQIRRGKKNPVIKREIQV